MLKITIQEGNVMTTQTIICLVVFVCTLISFIIGKITMANTAILAMLVLVFTGCLDAKTALGGFGNSNTIIMASMFIIASGFGRTKMVKKLSALIGKVSKGSFTIVLAGYVLINCLLCQFVNSSMACFSIVFPLACAMCDELGYSRSKMIFPIGMISIASVGALPLGGNAVAYLTQNGYLEAYEYTTYQWKMFDSCIGRLPSIIFLIIYCIFIAPKFCPEQPVIPVSDIKPVGSDGKAAAPLTPVQEILGYSIFFGVVLLLLTSSFHSIPSWEICMAGAAVMVASGILKSSQAYAAIGMGGMVMMYVGMLGVGNALTATGAATVIGESIGGMLGSNPNPYLVGAVFFGIPFALTQFMMNAAVINVFLPIAIITSKSLMINPIGPVLLVTIGSLTAFMTPMATPTVSMVMGLGGYDQKTLLKMSWLPAILMFIINVGWVMTVFPS